MDRLRSSVIEVDWNPLSLNVARLTLALAEAATRVTATEP
jgi:hypothetical protein